MLVVISPAKKLNMQPSPTIEPTQPMFGQDADELAHVMKKLSLDELQSLMGISANLARLNADRFASFGGQGKKPAALAFAGETYQGLEAATLEPEDMGWHKIIFAFCPAFMGCCGHLMRLSHTGLKWAASWPRRAANLSINIGARKLRTR